jgi:hypothetical protein
MVGIALIVALVLIAVVGVACAEDAPGVRTDIKVYKPAADSLVNPESATVCHDEDFYYIASFTTTSPPFVYIGEVNPLEVHFISNGKLYSFNCSPNRTGFKIEPSETVTVSFSPINFEGDFGKEIAKSATNVQYDCSYTLPHDIPGNRSGFGPTVEYSPILREVKWLRHPPRNLYYDDVLEVELFVDDEAGNLGHAYLSARNLSSNETKFDEIESDRQHLTGNRYLHKWAIKPEEHHFNKSDVNYTFNVSARYYNGYKENFSYAYLTVTEYIPKIIGGPYLNATADAFKFLGKNNKTEIDNIEWKDLDEGNFSFSVAIEDKIEKGSATLQVYRIKNDSITNYSLKSDEGEGFPYEYKYYNESIRFDRNDANTTISLRLNYSRPNLPSEFWNAWPKAYNITIIPFSIEFRNATVDHKEGYWDSMFNYFVEIKASKQLDITLMVYDPYREREPWIDLEKKRYSNVSNWEKLEWPDQAPFENNYCTEKSKFYFKYSGGESQVFFGPELKEVINVFLGPELVAIFRDPKIEPEEITIGDEFNYSIRVNGNKKLDLTLINITQINVTLKYLCDGNWISEGIDKPTITKEYKEILNETTLIWKCKAINSWEEVKMEVDVNGEKIDVY